MSSASALLACIERPDWNVVSYDVRLTILHQLNNRHHPSTRTQGMPPIDDACRERDNVFRRIKTF